MRLLAQTHGAGQARATLEGVQRAHAGISTADIGRTCQPAAQRAMQLRQQLLRFFFKNREQLGLDLIGQARLYLVRIGTRHRLVIGTVITFVTERLPQAVSLADGINFGLVRLQHFDQLRVVGAQETGGELMQQMADVVGRADEHGSLGIAVVAGALGPVERMLQRTRQHRQILIADGRGIAGQRVRQRLGIRRHRPRQFERPFGQAGAQPARQLVGLVQEDIEQRDADAQRPDHLDAVGLGLLGGQDRFGIRIGGERR